MTTFPMRTSRRQAFSLIELLIVVAIMAILATLSGPSMVQGYRAANLTQAGNRLADTAQMARQNAMSRNAMTALIMVTGNSSALSQVANRAVTLIELAPGQSSWTQTAAWTYLPSQAKAYPNTAALTPSSLPIPIGGSLPMLRIPASTGGLVSLGSSDYVCYVFNPDGTLYNASSPLPQAYVQYATDQAPSAGTQPTSLQNYYNLVFSDAGGIHIVRP